MKRRDSGVTESSGLHQQLTLLLAAVTLALGLALPAAAHKGKQHEQQSQAVSRPAATTNRPAGMPGQMAGEHGSMDMSEDMGEDMGSAMNPANLGFGERLLAWLGRIHPLLVHFPIAFFPAALFTAVVGRRRPAFSAPVQFLVVAGGIFAPIAAGAGLLAGMGADPDPILTVHRWLGVAIGLAGAGLGWWAWKRPWEDRGAGMILALTAMTVAIVAQGFLGASITHGLEHMMF